MQTIAPGRAKPSASSRPTSIAPPIPTSSRCACPGCRGLSLYFKDESSHPTGSLKHRLARSLFLYALANGWLHRGSHGRRGVERLDRDLRGLFRAPARPAVRRRRAAHDLAREDRADRVLRRALPLRRARRARSTTAPRRSPPDCGGHYLDQFTYAERATDWRGNNNIAESLFAQMRLEPQPEPRYIVCAAGHRRHVGHARAATCATAATRPKWWSPTPRTRCSSTTTSSGDRALTHPRGLAHRRHRTAARGSVLPARRHRRHGQGARRRERRGHALAVGDARPARRRFDGHHLLRRAAAAASACTRAAKRPPRCSSCATAASATRTATTTRTGSRRRDSMPTPHLARLRGLAERGEPQDWPVRMSAPGQRVS